MKKIRQFLVASGLTLILSLSIFAGEISIPGMTAPPSPTPTPTATSIACETGCNTTTYADAIQASDVITTDPFTEITLSLFQSVMSLF